MSITVSIDGRRRLAVVNLAEASEACRRFIDDNGLGASQWAGGAVREGRKLVARVSYNGRVWAPSGAEIVCGCGVTPSVCPLHGADEGAV